MDKKSWISENSQPGQQCPGSFFVWKKDEKYDIMEYQSQEIFTEGMQNKIGSVFPFCYNEINRNLESAMKNIWHGWLKEAM